MNKMIQKMIDWSGAVGDRYTKRLFERHDLDVVNGHVKCPMISYNKKDVELCRNCPWVEKFDERTEVTCNPPSKLPQYC